jgi:hypothetical protein
VQLVQSQQKMKIQFKASIQAWQVVGVILLVCGLQEGAANAAATITTFDAPGAGTGQFQGTFPTAINPARVITGYYLDANFVYHGFLRVPGGTFTSFDAPGAGNQANQSPNQGTQAFSINPAVSIAGYYTDTGGTTHCFLRAPNGTFTNIDPPGSLGSTEFAPSGTAPIVINPTGAITGNYYDANGLHGFLRAPGGAFTTFDPPGSPAPATIPGPQTYPMAINPTGVIAGSYFDVSTGTFRGFLRAPNGTIIAFDPSGSLLTQVEAIDPAGAITGWYFPNFYNGPVHGFLRAPNGNIISFDPPAPLPPLGVFPYAINPAGTITGNYFAFNPTTGGQYSGFLRAPGGAFTTFDPSGSQNTTTPTAINQAGEITGYYPDANFVNHGFLRGP